MPKYFDFHSHLNSPDYKDDLDEVISRMKETGTKTIVVGVDLKTSEEAVMLAEKYEDIYACIGIHPVDTRAESFDKEKFEKLIKNPKVVAVGECGFDFFHVDKEKDYERQKQLFIDQINFALEHNKPVMVHARNAYSELLEVLEPIKRGNPKLRGNIHFFAGNWETAERLLALDFTLSFTGVITFARDYDEVIKKVPLDKILSETDSPYVSPVPFRGKRNEPVFVREVAKKIALIRGEDEEEVRAALVNNALRVLS